MKAFALTSAVALLAGCATAPDAESLAASHRAVVDAVAEVPAPDAAWVAAIIGPESLRGRDDPERHEYVRSHLARATAAAPGDRLVAVVALRLCRDAPPCDERAAGTRLQTLDPQNGAALLPALALARREGDAAAVDRVLAAMAEGTHWNVYWTEALWRVQRVLAAAATRASPVAGDVFRSPESRHAYAVGVLAAVLPPWYVEVTSACAPGALTDDRRRACRRIADALQRSDTLGAQGVGTALALSLAEPGSPDHATAAAARLRHEWQLRSLARLPPQALLRRYPELVARMPREQDVVQALLHEFEVPLEPPAGWDPRTTAR